MTMYLGMRDVLAHRTIGDDYGVFQQHGITALEVRVEKDLTLPFVNGQPFSIATPAARQGLLAHLRERGVEIKGFLLCTKFDGSADEARWVRETARCARELGIASIRVDCGRKDPGDAAGRQKLLADLAPAFESLLGAAGELGVKLALENHGPFANRPEVMGALLDRFAARGLSLCLDTGNFYVTGGLPLSEVYGAIARFAPHVTTAHLKNASYPEAARETSRTQDQYPYDRHSIAIERGDIDHAKAFGILKSAGYAGPLFYEDESLYRVPEGVSKAQVMDRTLAALGRALGGV